MVDFSRMKEDDGVSGCEVHEFPNSCAVEVLTEFGYTPEAFDCTNMQVDLGRIEEFIKERTEHAQVRGAGHTPSLQLIVLNEDQIKAGIEDIVLRCGFTKAVETYAASYRNDVVLYYKCAWESREQAVMWLTAKRAVILANGYSDGCAPRKAIQAEYDKMVAKKFKAAYTRSTRLPTGPR